MAHLLKVLLVEDDAEEKDFFVTGLRKLNLSHQILWAKSHTELFETLELEPDIDLAVVDLNMPDKNGKECLKDIKAHEKYNALPVIIMTVSNHNSDIQDVFESGAHYYAIKPYSERNFIETLRMIFDIDWKVPQPIPERQHFIINLAFV